MQRIELQMWVPGLNSLVATAWHTGIHGSQKSNDFQLEIGGNSFLGSKLPTYLGVRSSFSMLSQKASRVSKAILRKKSFKTSFWSFSFFIIPVSLPCTGILAREEEWDSISKHDKATGTALPVPANVQIKLILDLTARIPARPHHMVSLKVITAPKKFILPRFDQIRSSFPTAKQSVRQRYSAAVESTYSQISISTTELWVQMELKDIFPP